MLILEPMGTGIFCCVVYKQYTKEMSCFECMSSFYGAFRCFGKAVLFFTYVFPQM